MKRLIITADEFGQSEDVNKAICELFKEGHITNTVLMANMLAAEEAIRLAKQNKINTGIHFNLTEGKPLSDIADVKSLVDRKGEFYKPFLFLTRYFFGMINLDDAEKELSLQAKKLHDGKIKLTHFDGHCYIQMLPGLMRIMIKIAKDYGMNKTRLAYEKWSYKANGIGSFFAYNFWFRKFLPSLFRNKLRKLLDENSIKHTDNFYGALIIDANDTKEKLLLTLDKIEEGTSELMVHPGLNSGKRSAENDALNSEAFRDKIKANGIELISYLEL